MEFYRAVNWAGEVIAILCGIKHWARYSIELGLSLYNPPPPTLTRVARLGAGAPQAPSSHLSVPLKSTPFLLIYLAVNWTRKVVASLCVIKSWARCSTICGLGDNVPSPPTLSRISPMARFGAAGPFTPSAHLGNYQCIALFNFDCFTVQLTGQ